MKMETEDNKNRVGIYTQVSAEATAAGEGLAPQGEKSPVAKTESIENVNETENPNESNDNVMKEEKNEEDAVPIISNTDDGAAVNTSQSVENQDNNPRDGDQGNVEDQHGGGDSITGDDGHSNYSGGNSQNDRPSKIDPSSRGYIRDQMNRATKLKEFPRAASYFGKERWSKALSALQTIGFVNWEINTMLKALDTIAERRELAEAKYKRSLGIKRKSLEPELRAPVKRARVENEKVAAIKRKDPNVLSGILMPGINIPECDIPAKHVERQEISYLDLRASIGDANHPEFHILPENQNQLQDELYLFIVKELDKYEVPIAIVTSFYINQTLIVECKNQETMEFLKNRLSELDEVLWPDAKLKLLERPGVRRKVQIFIPYLNYETKEILQIIKNQNKLKTEAWNVIKRSDSNDGISLFVEMDEISNLRIMNDQDDLFFLLSRVTVTLPVKDK